eukprot:TRINITY_DN12107_c0_g1_i13.p3 TRINITY_DN12107_c0_g1~~TRINITY_DN12107_c0_g1_i13.p3  ORF type:complete len:258 (-),score=39.75 TRINITY_DN12107_c0_g1_i13:1830-2603(-)
MEIDEEVLNQDGNGNTDYYNMKLLCAYGVDADGQLSYPGLDVVQQQMNGFAQVEVIQALTQDNLQQRIQSFQPQVTILMGAQDGDLITGTLGPLNFCNQVEQGDAEGQNGEGSIEQFSGESLAACFQGSSVETVIIAAPIHDHHEHIRQFGVSHVIHWEPGCKVYALPAFMFLHSFFGLLRNTSATVQEAYEVAIFSVQVHCGRLVAGEHKTPPTPKLNSDSPPCLPSNVSIPLPEISGMDFSKGVQAALPGWDKAY